MWTRQEITDRLGIATSDKGVIVYYLIDEHNMLSVPIVPAELPALLRELNAAAEAMQIPTAQGEMAKALEGLMVAFIEHIGPGEPMSNDDAKVIAAAKQALASNGEQQAQD